MSAAANRQGIVAMLAAMTLFSGSDALVKLATASMPPGEIMAVRGLFAILMLLGLVSARREGSLLPELRSPVVVMRSLTEAAVSFLFITSLSGLPLANANAILQATPIILALLGIALGLERVGWRRWCAIIVGFAGVLFVVKPSPAGMNIYALVALGCAALVAVRDLVTRRIKKHVPTSVVTLSSTIAVTLAGFALALGETWTWPRPEDLATLAGAAFLVTLGSLAVVKAFRVGEMSVVSPFRYSIILTSLALGYLVFGDWPDVYSFFGIALIVASGVYTLHREQVRLRRDAPATAALERVRKGG